MKRQSQPELIFIIITSIFNITSIEPLFIVLPQMVGVHFPKLDVGSPCSFVDGEKARGALPFSCTKSTIRTPV